jgi:hypothetical protein
MKNRELWPFLFLLGTALFNWPFLDIFSLSLPYYLFGLWAVFIAVMSAFITRANKEDRSGV